MKTKNIILALLYIMFFQSISAQVWPKFYSKVNSASYADDIIEMYDNGYLICGNFNTYNGGDFKQWSWLIKTDVNGDILWDKIIEGGDEFIRTTAVESTMDRGVLLCGLIWSEIGATDPYVLKLNACGEKEWCTIFASSPQTNPWAQDIKETLNGDIIVLVNQYGENNVEDMDLFKLNSAGELIWKETYCSGSVYTEGALPLGYRLAITYNGDYLISGNVYWENPWNPGGPKKLRPLFVMVDSIGTEKWVLPFGVQDSLSGEAISFLDIGSEPYIGVGYYWPDQGYDEGLIMEFDNEGNQLNFKRVNAKEVDSIYNRVIFNNAYKFENEVIFGGVMGVEFVGNPTMEAASNTNLFNNLQFYSNIQHSDLINPYVLGKTSSKVLSISTNKETVDWDIVLSKLNLNLEYDTLDSGNYTYDSLCTIPGLPQSGFIFLDDCDIITGVDIPSPEEYYAGLKVIAVTVFPNPAKDKVTFGLENTEHHKHITLKCFYLLGKQVFETRIITGQKEAAADVSRWPQGMYVAVVYSEGLPVGECKFVVE